MPFRGTVTGSIISGKFGGLPPPTISGISGIINQTTTTTITVNGSRFVPGSVVSVSGAATSNSPRTMSTTYVSATQLTFTTNAAGNNFVASAAFDIIVSNGPGSNYTLSSAGTVDPIPVWSTGAGTTFSLNTMSASSQTFSASDPQGVSISLVSGTIPSGLSLASSGVISGTVQWNTLAGAWTTNYPITLRATGGTVGDTADRAFNISVSNSYYYRQVYNYGYVVGGYSSSNPHYAAHRVTNSNDAYASLGNKLDQAAGYVEGGFAGDTYLWVMGTGGGLGGYSHYSGFNMQNETGGQNGDMGRTKDDSTAMANHGGRVGVPSLYTCGGGESTNVKLTASNNSISYVTSNGDTSNFGNGFQSDSFGYDCFAAQKFNYSSETWSGIPRPQGSNQAHSKSLSTKSDFAMVEDGGNGSFTFTRYQFSNDSLTNNWGTKSPVRGGSGETNYSQAQDWGYGLGTCGSSCQNGWFWRQPYSNSSGVNLGDGDRGMSSGQGAGVAR
jgi:hypothetical protein